VDADGSKHVVEPFRQLDGSLAVCDVRADRDPGCDRSSKASLNYSIDISGQRLEGKVTVRVNQSHFARLLNSVEHEDLLIKPP
jgi:hypothetical protein